MITSEQAKQIAINSIRVTAEVAFGSIQHSHPHWLVRFIFTYESGRTKYVVIKVNSTTGVIE